MLTHQEMIKLQADEHYLIYENDYISKEEHVLHMVHTFAYVQACKLAKNKTVLDLGCNSGYGTYMLSEVCDKVYGVDVSAQAIESANRDFGKFDIDFKLVDGITLPFEDNSFDLIVSFQVIEHIVDYDIYIGEIKRVLAPEGIVLFATPNCFLRLDPGMQPWNKFHVKEFNYSDLGSLLMSYFSSVNVLGLFADEPVYSIEVNRLSKARANARKGLGKTVRSTLKNILSSKMIAQLKNFRKTKLNTVSQEELKTFRETYGINNFYHQDSNLEKALDLLAVCSPSQDAKEDAEKILLKRNA